jgi:RHS repeat-associated protein
MVTVTGEEKPGRVRFSVTDLTVPIVGLPISIGRTYDSLDRERVGDFGYGWTLDVSNPRLTVNPAKDVTLTMPDGRRVTFFFTPDGLGFGFATPAYTAEAGVYGKLVANSCGLIVTSSGQYFCFPGEAYDPGGYTYTDPYGRVFVMEKSGKLQSITDLQGNQLTFTPNGIRSSSGLNVPFVRDGQGRITQITDPTGQRYTYNYDAAGDLRAVTLPSTLQPIQYEYYNTPFAWEHLFKRGVDPRGNTMVTAQYYPDGRLQKETNAVNDTFEYLYDVPNRKTTTLNPDGGQVIVENDSYGLLLKRTDELGRVTTHTYDAKRNLKTVTDPLNHTTTYEYDTNGHRTKVTDPLGNTVIEVTYNPYGGPSSLKNALGTTWTVGYYPNYLPQTVTDSLGLVGGYTWDARGSALSQTDGNGKISTFAYDAYGNRISETNALGQTATMDYDTMGRVTRAVDARGNATTYTHDGLGRMLSATNALNQTTTYEYDSNGNRTALIDALGRRTVMHYDAANRLIMTDFPDFTFTTTTYDFRGNRLTERDPNGNITRTTYDLAGQVETITVAEGTPDASTARRTYYTDGRMATMVDGKGFVTNYYYDAAGRTERVTDALNHETRSFYDTAGQLIRSVDANGRETRYEYDIRGRMRYTIYPDGTRAETLYDGAGRVYERLDQAGKSTRYTYDDVGRLLSVTNALNHATTYNYDANGNLLSILDANLNSTGFIYDALNRQQRKIWPDGTFEEWTYDTVGNMRFHRLADGNVNEMRYDLLNRLLTSLYFDGTQTSYTYTPNGLKQTVTDARGVTNYTYDAQNRVKSVVQPNGATVSYTYDLNSNRASMTSPAGTLSYTYDAMNRLKSVVSGLDTLAVYTYDPVGLRTQKVLANGVATDYTYDTLNRLTRIVSHKGPNVPLLDITYTIGTSGNRVAAVEGDGSRFDWTYDDTYRLLSETRSAGLPQNLIVNETATPPPSFTNPGTGGAENIPFKAFQQGTTPTPPPPSQVTWQTTFTYDKTGNRLTKSEGGVTTNYTYNNLDQLLTAGNLTYTYNARGNMTRAGDTIYTWDARDRMTGVTFPNQPAITHQYGDSFRRVKSAIGADVTNYIWDEFSPYGDVIQETDTVGTQTVSYILGSTELLTQNRENVLYYYLADGQNSTRVLADSNGLVVKRYTYDAFGEIRESVGSLTNKYQYTGQQFDGESGLYSLRARYYNFNVGRFVSRDKYIPDLFSSSSPNKYNYVNSSPVKYYDPSGYDALLNTASLLPTVSVSPTIMARVALVSCATVRLLSGVASIAISLFSEHGSGFIGATVPFVGICYSERVNVYHYSKWYNKIFETGEFRPSLDPNRTEYGVGLYVTDISNNEAKCCTRVDLWLALNQNRMWDFMLAWGYESTIWYFKLSVPKERLIPDENIRWSPFYGHRNYRVNIDSPTRFGTSPLNAIILIGWGPQKFAGE